MWLVDTSVWILVFRREDPLDLTKILSFDEIVTCLPVVQESCRGSETNALSASPKTRCAACRHPTIPWVSRLSRRQSIYIALRGALGSLCVRRWTA